VTGKGTGVERDDVAEMFDAGQRDVDKVTASGSRTPVANKRDTNEKASAAHKIESFKDMAKNSADIKGNLYVRPLASIGSCTGPTQYLSQSLRVGNTSRVIQVTNPNGRAPGVSVRPAPPSIRNKFRRRHHPMCGSSAPRLHFRSTSA
jgi:hypothetical protein